MPPKPKDPDAEVKRRSRNGCNYCKTKKVKCNEEKPTCSACLHDGVACDYSVKLNWDGRKKNPKAQPVAWASVPLQSLNKWTIPKGPYTSVFQTASQTVPGSSTQSSGTSSQVPSGDNQASGERFTVPDAQVQHVNSNVPSGRSQWPGGYQMPSDGFRGQPMSSLVPGASSYIPTPSPTPTSAHRSSFGFGPVDNNPKPLETTSRPVDSIPRVVDDTSRPLHHRSTSYADVSSYKPQNDPLSARSVEHCPVIYTPSRSSPIHRPYKYQRVTSNNSSSKHRDTSHDNDEDPHVQTPPNRASIPAPAIGQQHRMPPPPKITLPGIKSFDNLVMAKPVTPQSSTRSATDFDYLAKLMSQGGSNSLSRVEGPYIIYGIDRGIRDLDLDLNDDANALAITPPEGSGSRRHLHDQVGLEQEQSSRNAFGFGDNDASAGTGYNTTGPGSLMAGNATGYYSRDVIVHMPRPMPHFPDLLINNDMNMLYFHHFMNHTASVMVPHDCANNPFRSFLPQLALQDEHLLKILLAYSACHRARYLHQQPPVKRIATYTSDVFRRLADDLQGPKAELNYIHLAKTIMLASLKIIAPESFEGQMTWETPLAAAKEMILERGGWSQLFAQDETGYFLQTWFAYLDVVGSLTGSQYDASKVITTPTVSEQDADRFWQVDCLLGFTARCIRILAKVAALCKLADKERIKDQRILTTWRPTVSMLVTADVLKAQLENSAPRSFRLCQHDRSLSGEEQSALSVEMLAVNDSFHWAGLIHLYKRVYGLGSRSPEVQMLVRNISSGLHRVRLGSSAEHGMIFPMFTAGCEALEEEQRQYILDRLHTVERSGMMQVGRARSLMVRVWETGCCWESLATGEFLG